MGKRKLNNTTFYQCDWTGIALKAAHCYLPTWHESGKLAKRGSYANWECVVAHIDELVKTEKMTRIDADRAVQHIAAVVGCAVDPAPHYTELVHTNGKLNYFSFAAACTDVRAKNAVLLRADGGVEQIAVTPGRAMYDEPPFLDFAHHLPRSEASLSSFHSMRKKGSKHDQDLCVHYYADKTLPLNTQASTLFKMQLYGDVILILQSREYSYRPRTRYVDFTREQFEDYFAAKKRKRAPDAQALEPESYKKLKDQMQDTLNQFEQTVSKKAVPPRSMSKQPVAVQKSGSKLAQKLKERGVVPPTPPPVPTGA